MKASSKARAGLVIGLISFASVASKSQVYLINNLTTDYGKFLIEVVSPREPDEYRLAPEMHREMMSPQIALPKAGQIDGCTAWGLGWGIKERPSGNLLVHSGGQSGFRALALASLETKSGLIMLTNGDNGGKVIFHPKVLALADKLVSGG